MRAGLLTICQDGQSWFRNLRVIAKAHDSGHIFPVNSLVATNNDGRVAGVICLSTLESGSQLLLRVYLAIEVDVSVRVKVHDHFPRLHDHGHGRRDRGQAGSKFSFPGCSGLFLKVAGDEEEQQQLKDAINHWRHINTAFTSGFVEAKLHWGTREPKRLPASYRESNDFDSCRRRSVSAFRGPEFLRVARSDQESELVFATASCLTDQPAQSRVLPA